MLLASFLIVAFSYRGLASGNSNQRVETRMVHAGCEPELNDFNVVPPISLSTSMTQPFPGIRPGIDNPNSHGQGFYYSRAANPTRGALERALASVEAAKHGTVYSSGLAATQAVIQLLASGDHVLALDDLYGGTSTQFRNIIMPGSNIQFSFVNLDNLKAVEAALRPETKMIWMESPTVYPIPTIYTVIHTIHTILYTLYRIHC